MDEVKVGQLWADIACRTPRTLQINRLVNLDGVAYAACTVIETKKEVRVLVRRLKPSASGYLLVQPRPVSPEVYSAFPKNETIGNFPKGD